MVGSGVRGLVVAVVTCLVVCAAYADEVELGGCSGLLRELASCLSYLRRGGIPTAACCKGVRTLAQEVMSGSKADRQRACRCLVNAAKTMPGLNSRYLKALPAKCKVRIPWAIDPKINCSKIN